jgi:hypothetical protein
MTAEQFAGGEVAYLLDGGSGTHRGDWTQDEEGGYPKPGGPSFYKVTLTSGEGGTITVDDKSVDIYKGQGKTVTITATPDPSPDPQCFYELVSLKVNGSPININDVTQLTFTMPGGDTGVEAEFALRGEVRITPEVSGFSGGATVTIGDAAGGDTYIARTGDTVTVTVTLLPHPAVEGAASANYVLKSLIVRFEDESTLDITDSRQFTATGNAVVTAEIDEVVVMLPEPPIPEPPVPEPPGDPGGGDGGGLGDGDGDVGGSGDGEGIGTGEGTADNASEGETSEEDITQPPSGVEEQSDANNVENVTAPPQKIEESEQPEELKLEENPQEEPEPEEEEEKEQAPPEESDAAIPITETPQVEREAKKSPLTPAAAAAAAAAVTAGAGGYLMLRRLWIKK